LLEGFTFDDSGAPGAQERIDGLGPQYGGLQVFEIVPGVFAFQTLGRQQRHSLLTAAARRLQITRRLGGKR